MAQYKVKNVACGGAVHCIVHESGKTYCAGDNTYGQLGDGTNNNSSNFGEVVGITDPQKIIIVAAGFSQAVCSLNSNNTISCWRRRSAAGGADSNTPVTIVDSSGNVINDFIDINGLRTFGYCGLHGTGKVSCWGLNSQGQIGNGTTTSQFGNVAYEVSGLTDVIKIRGGDHSNCALKSDGTIWCWGKNASGELGDNTSTLKTTPVQFGSTLGSLPSFVDIKVFY